MDQLRIIVNQNTFCGTMYQKYFCRDISPKRGSIQQVNCLNCPVDQYHVVVEEDDSEDVDDHHISSSIWFIRFISPTRPSSSSLAVPS